MRNATAAGTLGFTTTGALILPTGPAPVGAVGIMTFDLSGNATGSQDRSVGGAFAHETLSGTLTISADCAVSLIADVFDNSGNLVRTSKIDGVLVNNGKQVCDLRNGCTGSVRLCRRPTVSRHGHLRRRGQGGRNPSR